MEIIKPSTTILAMTGHKELPYSYEEKPELLIEVCGRTCYKSEDKITDGSAGKFVEMIKKRKHGTVLEHSWEVREYSKDIGKMGNWCKYLWFSRKWEGLIGGNFRAWIEAEEANALLRLDYTTLSEEDVRFDAIEDNEPYLMAATVRVVCDRGVSHEAVRHRPPGISQESTRYVNYSNKGMQFIAPVWISIRPMVIPAGTWTGLENIDNDAEVVWARQCVRSEESYNDLISLGWTPEKARSVLTNSLKTEFCITSTLYNWQHIFRMRAGGLAGKPHPQMVEIMEPLLEEFKKLEPTFFSEIA